MASVKTNGSLSEYQDFVKEVYGHSNERHFTIDEMLTNISRFSMRALKGIRKNDPEKIKINITVAMSWFMSMMSQLSVDLEESVWKRFPYFCSYCGKCPCVCKKIKIHKRVQTKGNVRLQPKTVRGLQEMFAKIYPPSNRTLEHAGIHLAEEVGELSESVLHFRGHHSKKDFDQIILEAADLFSCFMGVFNSIGVDYEKELTQLFSYGCHVCKNTPCTCDYEFVMNFKS